MDNLRYHHAHPLTILKNCSSVLFLLIIPLARGALTAFTGGGLAAWLKGAWFDVLVVLFILGFATIRWWLLVFKIDKTGLYVKLGLFLHREFFIPMDNISTFAVERTFFFKPFRAVMLRVDTMAGNSKNYDFEVIASKKYAAGCFDIRKRRYKSTNNLTRSYSPSSLYIAALSAFLSNSFTGVIFASAFISRAGTVLGQKLEERVYTTINEISKAIALGIPPIATAIAIVIIFGWFIGFAQNMLVLSRFKAVRTKRALTIQSGIFTNRTYSVLVDKINYLDIRQSLMTRLLRLYLVFIHCTGYGKGSEEVSALIPATSKNDMYTTLALLLPEFTPKSRAIKPAKGSIFRYIMTPFWILVLLPVPYILVMLILPSWGDLTRFLTVMACIPLFWMIFLKIVDYATAGITLSGNVISMRYSKGYVLHTVVVPLDKVALITTEASVFQKMFKACDIVVYTYTEGNLSITNKHRVRNVLRQNAVELLKLE